MSSIKMWLRHGPKPRIAKFRSPIRDAATDDQRVAGIRSALGMALGKLDAELAGLSRRVEETRGRVGSIMGNEDGSLFAREPEDEQILREAELELLSGTKRLEKLRRQRIALVNIGEQLEIFSAG